MNKFDRECCEYVEQQDRMSCRGRRRTKRRERAEAMIVKHANACMDEGKNRRLMRSVAWRCAKECRADIQTLLMVLNMLATVIRMVREYRKKRELE